MGTGGESPLKLDVLAIGAHPDDVELGCGGTLVVLAEAGRRVGVLHLTSGELGTRGTPEQRRDEARRAAQILGVELVGFLDCGDGGLRHTSQEEDVLIDVLRERQPDLVLGPTPQDRHPDHGRAHRLVKDACFYAGLRQRSPERQPHRPAAVFSYMQHDPFPPSFVVDVSSAWEKKLAAVAAYESQMFAAAKRGAEPETKIASRDFALALEGRARHFGMLAGGAYGEPFWSPLPLAVRDLLSILPTGLR
jgi:bacillithiol biosynthesis deacetylase BshB1